MSEDNKKEKNPAVENSKKYEKLWHTLPELVVSIGSILIAIVALAFSYLEHRDNNTFIRASLTPKVNFDSGHSENGWYISIANDGLGPAEVKWFRVFVDGSMVHDWREVLTTIGLKKSVSYDFSMIYPGSVITANQSGSSEKKLVSIDKSNESIYASKNAFRIEPVVCVCSFFDACEIIFFEFDKKALLHKLENQLPECSAEYQEDIPPFLTPRIFASPLPD